MNSMLFKGNEINKSVLEYFFYHFTALTMRKKIWRFEEKKNPFVLSFTTAVSRDIFILKLNFFTPVLKSKALNVG